MKAPKFRDAIERTQVRAAPRMRVIISGGAALVPAYAHTYASYDRVADEWTDHGMPGVVEIDGAGVLDRDRDLYLFVDALGSGGCSPSRSTRPTPTSSSCCARSPISRCCRSPS
jgi:hypothetical protein